MKLRIALIWVPSSMNSTSFFHEMGSINPPKVLPFPSFFRNLETGFSSPVPKIKSKSKSRHGYLYIRFRKEKDSTKCSADWESEMVEASNHTSLLCRSIGAGLLEHWSLKGTAGISSSKSPWSWRGFGVWGRGKGRVSEGEGCRNKRGQACWVDGGMGQQPIENLRVFQIPTRSTAPNALNVGRPLFTRD